LLAARLLLPEGRGELAALMLWPGLVCELGGLALSDALLYRLASGAATPRRLFAAMVCLAAALTLVLVPVGVLMLPHVMATQDADIRMIAPWVMAAYIPSYFAALFLASLFQGLMEIVTWNLVRAVVPTAYLLGIAVLGVTIAPEAPEFAAAFVAAQLFSAALGLALVARRGWLAIVPARGDLRALVVYGAKAHASEVLHSLRLKLDQAVVALLLVAADLGLYAVALTVANGPLILVQTAYNVAFPKISGQATREGKVLVFGRYLRLTLATVLAIDVVLIAVNHWLIPLLFGRAFAPAVHVANLLLIGLVPYAAKLMFAAALKAADRALAIPRAEIVGLIVIGPALFVLVPGFGLLGAAAASVLAQAASAVVLGLRLGRELELRPLQLMVPTREDVALLRGYLDRALNRA
jgi:O-antigen/teichoic acid export membrane protein